MMLKPAVRPSATRQHEAPHHRAAPAAAPASPRSSAPGTPRFLQRKALEVDAGESPLEREADMVAEQIMRMPDGVAPAGIAGAEAAPSLAWDFNRPEDIYEQEADRLADHVTATPEPQLQRACHCGGDCPSCQAEQPGQETGRLQTKRVQASDAGRIPAPPIVHEALRSPGQPLDPATRRFMEPRFGHDFGQVRVHSGAAAEQSARDVNADAYTVGRDLVFGAGLFTPGSHQGRRLIAHELTHVMQQSGAGGMAAGQSNYHGSPDTLGRSIARRPRTGATGAAPTVVRQMARDEALRVLEAYLATAQDDTFVAMNAIVATLRMSSTPKNWRIRLRLLTAAFSLLDEGGATSVLKALTKPVDAKQEYLRQRFERLDSDFRRPLLQILRERAAPKPARAEEQGREPPEAAPVERQATWIELEPGIFAYLTNAGMTIDDVAAYVSGHPAMPDALAKLNGVARTTRLPQARPVVIPIEFIDRANAIRQMPEPMRRRIASTRAAQAQQAQYRRLVQARSGHPLGPGAVGPIPVTELTARQIGSAVDELLKSVSGPLTYAAAFIFGLLEGAWDAVVDLFKGAADLIKTIAEVLYHLFTDNPIKIYRMLRGWVRKLELAWEKRGDIASDFMDKWEARDPWDRGRFQGKVLGWVMMTALIVILTWGAGAIVQISGKWKFVIDALKLAEQAGDLGTYVRAAGRLPGNAADVVRRKLGLEAGPVPGETAEKAAKESVKKGAARGAKELADENLSAKHITPDGEVIKITKDGRMWICTNPCDEFAQSYHHILEKNKDLADELEKIRKIADPKTQAEALTQLKAKADKAPITELQGLPTEGAYRFISGGKVHRGNSLRLTPGDWKHILESHVKSTFDATKRAGSAVSTVFKKTPAEYLEILEEAVKNKAVIRELNKGNGKIRLMLRNQEWTLSVDLIKGEIKTFHATGRIANKLLLEVIKP